MLPSPTGRALRYAAVLVEDPAGRLLLGRAPRPVVHTAGVKLGGTL